MPAARLQITSAAFDFRRLVFSHGWVFLAPFQWTEQNQTLSRPLRLADGGSAVVRVRAYADQTSTRIIASIDGAPSHTDRAIVKDQLRRMLRLDDDYSPFHALCADDPLLSFVAESRCGGMLRCPTAFEDLIKTICTINCDWRNTKRMCERLCALDLAGNFPTPQRLLRLSESRLAQAATLGYRARTVRAVARLTADGKLPLDNWARQGDFNRITHAVQSLWGIGPYALNHMLVLLGRYDAIPVDGEGLKYLRQTHFNGRAVSEHRAVSPYERYGSFRFLAFKFARIARRENYINRDACGRVNAPGTIRPAAG